ncbi:MAG: HNH endonuclease [Planctomycetes bacterium]|nr:HNH endonuclease [Planctomycetota bacterium]
MSVALDLPVLVLNRHWTPVHVTSVKHAIVLACKSHASFVCPVTYTPHSIMDWIERGVLSGSRLMSARFEMESPEIIVLGDYDRVPPRGIAFNRRNLIRRDDNTCQYCGKQHAPDGMTIDHVTPLSRGGPTDWENCVLACHRCNGRKANRTPAEANMKLLKKPFKPEWSPRYAVYARINRPASWNNFIPKGMLETAGAE